MVSAGKNYVNRNTDFINNGIRPKKHEQSSMGERVRRYFNPEFDPVAFRHTVTIGLLAMLLAELIVYILLQQSADLGELPNYTTDAVIMGIPLLEFLVIPVISGLGLRRRRSMLVGWTLVALLCWIPLYTLPRPDITAEPGLCSTTVVPFNPQSAGISAKAAVRLSMLLISAVVCALGRAVFISHGIAYLDEHNPSDNLHMHVGIILLYRVMVYLVGSSFRAITLDLEWLQMSIVLIKFSITLLRLFRFPETPPVVGKMERRNGTGLFHSMGRVLGNRVAVLQILAMTLLVAAWWGFGTSETDFVLVKFHIRPDDDSRMGLWTVYIRLMVVMISVLLAGYMYTTPIMPKFERLTALRSAAIMCFTATLFYVLMTALLGCHPSRIAGLGEQNYTQPACARDCSCDRPWMKFTPVCVPEQMTTYFSPCHAGCAISDTVNGVGIYSNCACAAGGRVIAGVCDDGSCASGYSSHLMFSVIVSLCSTLALPWQITVMLESVEKRDVGVAVGLASGVVSLFAFAGAHGFYMGISAFTCAFARGPKCLLHNDIFTSWVGYSSAVLAGLSFVLTIVCRIIIGRQKESKDLSL